ncbi:MAG: TrkH family potassium uptake protein [Planctomycetes bacterium]|nr:TrkH family potassium uptake protein [Planctomycetota bacterium]
MNFAHVARVLAGFTVFFTIAQLVPLLMALGETADQHTNPLAGFSASMVIGGAVAAILGVAGRKAQGQLFRKEAIAVAGFAWLLASVLGAIPFQWSGLLPDPIDAVFETASGLTTCGATVLGTAGNPTPEATPQSLLLWRALTQWIGGIGIVLVFVALLPAMGISGKNLLTTEAVGVASDSFQPRALAQARSVAGVYLGLTAACTAALMATGFGFFDAICHAFTTLATGGYSTKSSIAVFDNLGAEIVLTTFMYIGGCSFAVIAASLRTGFTAPGALLRTSEFRCYTAFVLAAVTAVTIDLLRNGKDLGAALREASFNVVSMISCCGYATANFQAWPPLSLILLFICTIIGGCSGSAAGGLKQVRFLISIKLLAYQLRHFVRPKVVDRIRLDDEVLPAATISSVLAMVLLWLLAILIGALIIACDSRMTFVGAFSASASMLANAGPAMTVVQPAALEAGLPALGQVLPTVGPDIGPMAGFGDLRPLTKLAMAFEMILGRLELLTLLALFSPGFWRR